MTKPAVRNNLLEDRRHLFRSRLLYLFVSALTVCFYLAPAAAQSDLEVYVSTDDPMEMRRAVLGVNISAGDRHGGAVEGVLVVAVTPGGPADEAGIRSDDLLLSVNGTSLAADAAWRANRKLLRFMRSVEPGDQLTITYKRGDEPRETTVEAGELTEDMLPQGYAPEFLERWDGEMPDLSDLPFRFSWRSHSMFSGMELVELTPGLGKYFKADEGLLVVRAPDDPQLQLEDGDVIVSIGERVPRSPDHAMRILRSYAPGEDLQIGIIRNKKKRTLSIRLPEQSRQSYRYREQRPDERPGWRPGRGPVHNLHRIEPPDAVPPLTAPAART